MKRELVLASAFYALAAVAMTWPLTVRLSTELPVGGDNIHLAWALAWIARTIVLDPLSVFDGNIFHPAAKTIALSDPNVSSAILVAPAWWLTGDPALLVNLLFLWSFVLCGIAAHALAREWGAGPLGGLAAGTLFAFSPLRFSHVDHVQLYAFWWTPLALLGLDRFLRTGNRAALALAALCLVLQAYASLYLAVFAGAAVVVHAVVSIVTGRLRVSWSSLIGNGLAVGAVAIALCMPLALAYAEVRLTWGASRSIEQNVRYSASPLAYLSAFPSNLVWGTILERFADPIAPWEKYLFPGLIPVTLALAAALRDPRAFAVRFGFSLAVLAWLCSLGPYLVWYGETTGWPLPYLVAWEMFPPLQGLRGPARWALLGSLGLAIAAAHETARLPRPLVVGALLIALVESYVIPFPTSRVPFAGPSRLDDALARLAEGAVIELPMPQSAEEHYDREPQRVFRSAFHQRPIVNGYSGFTPPPYRALRDILATQPPGSVLSVLSSWDVRTIVLHEAEMAPSEVKAWKALVGERRAHTIFEEPGVTVLTLDLAASPAASVTAHLAEPRVLALGGKTSAELEFDDGSPFALSPAIFGWHRGLARWTSRRGAVSEHRFRYFCPPAVFPGLPESWRTAFVETPASPGDYEMRFSGACFELEATVTVVPRPD